MNHKGNFGVKVHSETYCTNESIILDKKDSGLKILQVIIEKFRTTIIRDRKRGVEKTITETILMQRHDFDPPFSEREMNRTLYVLLDRLDKTLYATLDLPYLKKKADYLDKFLAEIKQIKKIF